MRRRWLARVAIALLCLSVVPALLVAGLVSAPQRAEAAPRGPSRAPVQLRAPRGTGTAALARPGRSLGASMSSLASLQVDYWNSDYYYRAGGENTGRHPPQWVSRRVFPIDARASTFPIDFRYATPDPAVTAALWQVARLPFPADAERWQDQHVSALVASGKVTDYRSDGHGAHAFQVDFAAIAAQPLEGPRATTGGSGRSREAHQPVLPVGPRRAPIAAGEHQATPAPPRGAVRVPRGAAFRHDLRATTSIHDFLPQLDQVYYVRVVPLHGDGSAGAPSSTVEIVVTRPKVCPTAAQDIVVRPPSARIVWYMRPSFGSLPESDRRWYTAVSPEDFAGEPNVHVAASSWRPQKYFHWYDSPPSAEEKTWFDRVGDRFNGIVNYFNEAMTTLAGVWREIQDFTVQATAELITYTATFGVFHCEKNATCKAVIHGTLDAVMVYYGIPPELPTGPELMHAGEDYLLQLAVDELGARQVYDAAEAAYGALPDGIQEKMEADAKQIASDALRGNQDRMTKQIAAGTCVDLPTQLINPGAGAKEVVRVCSPRIPDPIFNAAHPASIMVLVDNPNREPTDAAVATVQDSLKLFHPAQVLVPSLHPGQSLSIPVVLHENLEQFLDVPGGDGRCKADAPTVSGQDRCEVRRWRDKLQAKLLDQFKVTFATGMGSTMIGGLDDRAAGRRLEGLLAVELNGVCTVPGVVTYPPAWRMARAERSIVPDALDDLFRKNLVESKGNPQATELKKACEALHSLSTPAEIQPCVTRFAGYLRTR